MVGQLGQGGYGSGKFKGPGLSSLGWVRDALGTLCPGPGAGGPAESVGQTKARRVLEIRTNPDGYEGGGTSLSTGTSVWWGLHAGACLRMWSAGESGP